MDLKGGRQWRYAISFLSFAKKLNKNSSRKTVFKMWSQILSKMAVLVHLISLKKSGKN